MGCAYVTLIVLAALFSMACNKIRLKVRVSTKKIQGTQGWDIPRYTTQFKRCVTSIFAKAVIHVAVYNPSNIFACVQLV